MTAVTPLRPMRAVPATASLQSILGALSHAFDLTEGAPPGHSVRSAVIGMRLAHELGVDESSRVALFYALLLKDAGCSSNAAKVSALFGSSDHIVKPRLKAVDSRDRVRLAWETFRVSSVGASIRIRIRTLLGIARAGEVTKELIQIRCERGAAIADRLGFPEETGAIIRALDEHWDGRGHPTGLRGAAIPLGARIANLAQTLEVYFANHDAAMALAVLADRRGTWFDPHLVERVRGWRDDRDWWHALRQGDADALLAACTPPAASRAVSANTIDLVAEAFADIVDAKSPYTYRHSTRVALWAERIAQRFTDDRVTLSRVYRAALLHDIGKLGVSNQLLDKPGRLTPEERVIVEQHPLHTFRILSRVEAFADIAELAALHHEKLDGSGYPWRRTGETLDRWARVLTVADIFEALTATRPYRDGLPVDEVLRRLEQERGLQLDGEVLDALADVVATTADVDVSVVLTELPRPARVRTRRQYVARAHHRCVPCCACRRP
jgi:HD-GYP domain-containing protein (c-di-GMP phosphodiesterase class II)